MRISKQNIDEINDLCDSIIYEHESAKMINDDDAAQALKHILEDAKEESMHEKWLHILATIVLMVLLFFLSSCESRSDQLKGSYQIILNDLELNNSTNLTWEFNGMGLATLKGQSMGIDMRVTKSYNIQDDSVFINRSETMLIKGDTLISEDFIYVKVF